MLLFSLIASTISSLFFFKSKNSSNLEFEESVGNLSLNAELKRYIDSHNVDLVVSLDLTVCLDSPV